MNEYQYRALAGEVDTPKITYREFAGVSYMVVPVIALYGDIVVHGIGAPGPELVPADVLEMFPDGWNYRPAVLNHPPIDAPTANTTEFLEQAQIGVVFGARYDEGALRMEAWIDETRVAEIGEDAIAVINEIKSGERTAVSIGAGLIVEVAEGIHNGMSYVAIWRFIVPDHLALLTLNLDGACSVEIGCGAKLTAAGKGNTMPVPKEGYLATLGRMLRAGTGEVQKASNTATLAAGVSTDELESKLWEKLREIEPGFAGVIKVFPEDSTVVYEVYIQKSYTMYERGYSLAEDGTVTIADDRVQVHATMRFEPIQAEDGKEDPPPASEKLSNAAPCGCGGAKDMDKKKIIDRLMARGFSQEKRAALEALPIETLTLMEEAAPATSTTTAAPATTATETTPAQPAPAAATENTEDEPAQDADAWLEKTGAPAEVADEIRESLAAARLEKAALVTELAGTQKVYDKARLEAMRLSELREVKALCESNAAANSAPPKTRNYPRAMAKESVQATEQPPVPRPWTAAFKK